MRPPEYQPIQEQESQLERLEQKIKNLDKKTIRELAYLSVAHEFRDAASTILEIDERTMEEYNLKIRKLVQKEALTYFDTTVPAMPLEIVENNGAETFAGTKGDIIKVTPNVLISIDAEENEGLAQNMVKTLALRSRNFIASTDSPYKAHIQESPSTITVRIDEGKHRQAIGLSKANEGLLVYYNFQPSSYEKEQYKDTASPRIKFIEETVRAIIRSDRDAAVVELTEGRGEYRLLFRISDRDPQTKSVQKLIDLTHSVKDLDFYLQNTLDVQTAIAAFKRGVVNLKYFINFTSQNKIPESGMRIELTVEEQQELTRYFETKTNIEEFRVVFERVMKNMERAKSLNYIILNQLHELDNQAREIISSERESEQKATAFLKLYRKMFKNIQAMKSIIEHLSFAHNQAMRNVSIEDLEEKNYPAVEGIAHISHFGYGTDGARDFKLGNTDWKDAKKRVSTVVEKAYEKFLRLFEDSGRVIENWDEVHSIEEAVRFLHLTLVKNMSMFRNSLESMQRLPFAEVFRQEIKNLPKDFFVIDTRSRLEKKKIFESFADTFSTTIDRLGDTSRLKLDNDSGRKNIAIFGDNYMELSLLTGKHTIEINAQIDEKNQSGSITFRYVESATKSPHRPEFTRKVLERLNFKPLKNIYMSNRGQVNMILRTEDPEKFNQDVEHIIRLATALQDLDLNANSRIESEGVEWFFDGLTSIGDGYAWDRFFASLAQGEKNVEEYEYLIKKSLWQKDLFQLNFLFKSLNGDKKMLDTFSSMLTQEQRKEFIEHLNRSTLKISKEERDQIVLRLEK